MNLTIDSKKLFYFSTSFILFTAIGTISHEYGHIIVAKALGYETTLHYGSAEYGHPTLYEEISAIHAENTVELENGLPFDDRERYDDLTRKFDRNRLMITIGGPLQTILTGILGLLMLYFKRRKINEIGLKPIDWLAIFLSLFWLREIANLFMSISFELIRPDGNFFGGDEAKISQHLNLPMGTVPLLLGVTGLVVALYVIFKVIPAHLRLTFILGGLIGGICGFVLWMNIIGPVFFHRLNELTTVT